AVQVQMKDFEIAACERDYATFRADVDSGTYMRSVAHDLGQRLGCGAHLASLRRTAVAEFSLADALSLERLTSVVELQPLDELFVHPRKLLAGMASVPASEASRALIRTGRPVTRPEPRA